MNKLAPLEVSINQWTLKSGDMHIPRLLQLDRITRLCNTTLRQCQCQCQCQCQYQCHHRLVNNRCLIIRSIISPCTSTHHPTSNQLITRLRLLFPLRMERSKLQTGRGSQAVWQLVDWRSRGPRNYLGSSQKTKRSLLITVIRSSCGRRSFNHKTKSRTCTGTQLCSLNHQTTPTHQLFSSTFILVAHCTKTLAYSPSCHTRNDTHRWEPPNTQTF